MKKPGKLLKWGAIAALGYFVLTSIYFGLGDMDPKTGMTFFYWSGMDDLGRTDKASGLLIDEPFETFLNGTDGPYVFGDTAFYVTADNKLTKKGIDATRTIVVETGLEAFPEFTVKLNDTVAIGAAVHPQPDRVVAISDMEGNFAAFYHFLRANEVVDRQGNWAFGQGSLVLNGDFLDRGSAVTPMLWFIYWLENQAERQGGRVHYILGNHEVMNLYGDASDNDHKYIEVAKRISHELHWDTAMRYLYGTHSVLGEWLRCKHVAEKIGNDLFVHGGLNAYHLRERLTLAELNATARRYLGRDTREKASIDARDQLVVCSPNSPYWDRRLNLDWKIKWAFALNGSDIDKTTPDELESILEFYDADRIIIGHSIVRDVTMRYGDNVIAIDVQHGGAIPTGRTRGLLMADGAYWKIDDLGNRHRLRPHDRSE